MEPSAATLTGSVATEELQKVPAFDPEVVAAELEDASAEEALRWALDTFHPRMYIAASFQKTSSVTVHMATQINPEARFFYLDTDVLFPETYETKDRLEERYGITFHRYSSMTLEQQAGLYGDELWARDPDACCGIRKVDPMRSALSAVDCWVSGIRRQDSQTRAKRPQVRLGQALRALEAEPARRLDREGRLALHRRARHPLQPAARPGLSLDRLHPLHPQAGRGRGRPRGTLGGHLEDRVRPARLSRFRSQGTN